MSTTSAKSLAAIALLLMSSSLGCWEQNLPMWFPQMKRQIAVQPFEAVPYNGQVEGFMPPEDSVPIGWADVPEVKLMTQRSSG